MGLIKRKENKTHEGRILSVGNTYFIVIDTKITHYGLCFRCAFYNEQLFCNRDKCNLYFGEYYKMIDGNGGI